MTGAEEKEKAEKLAAAKKRFEQLKKQKGKKGGPLKKEAKAPADDSSAKAADAPDDAQPADDDTENKTGDAGGDDGLEGQEDEPKAAEKSGNASVEENGKPSPASSSKNTPSLSLQSKIRSSSFRRSSNPHAPLSPTTNNLKSPTLPPLSPDGDSVTDIYRKQAARIDELEKENKKLEKDFHEGQTRRKKMEDEVDDLREAQSELTLLKERAQKSGGKEGEAEKLRIEVASLQRQNAHLQSQTTKSRHVASPSQGQNIAYTSNLEEALLSKSSTIESMEMEISNLRAQLDRETSSSATHHDQVSALEDKLEKWSKAAESAQRELTDLKKNLERTSERAVKEGSQRTSAETKIRSLERELAETKKRADELSLKCEALEKKANTLATLHKESDSRSHARSREQEKTEKEVAELRRKLATKDNELQSLREEKERWRKRSADGVEDDGVDELEEEERAKLQSRVRELESEVFDLKRGVWKERRKELEADEGAGSNFDDVDLGGAQSPRRGGPGRGQGLSHVISDSITALTGRPGPLGTTMAGMTEDDDLAFDEDAFRVAQEEEARKRVERVKEIKRGLKEWEGWRLDLVESRAGGGGIGEIFDV